MDQHFESRNSVTAAGVRSVLIVEDDADSREILMELVSMLGHEAATAATGAEALQRAGEKSPDITFVDIGLPDVDGYEVARRIRQHPHANKTYLIALTGYSDPYERKNAESAGFDEYIVKPLELDELRRVFGRFKTV